MENNGKSLKNESLKKHRKKVIALFSQHCKSNGWGKVYASQRLSEYIHPALTKENIEARKAFIRKWDEVIETVINKPSKTTLSKLDNRILFDYIEMYVSDMLEDEYFSHKYEHIYTELKNVLKNLTPAIHRKNTSKDFDKIIDNQNNFLINALNTQDRSKTNHSEEWLYEYESEFVLLKQWDNGIYKFCYIYPNKLEEKSNTNKNIRYLRGILIKQSASSSVLEELTGLVIDEVRNKFLTVKISIKNEFTQANYFSFDTIEWQRKHENVLIKIEGDSSSFPHCRHETGKDWNFKGDLLFGYLRDANYQGDIKKFQYRSKEIQKAIDNLKLI